MEIGCIIALALVYFGFEYTSEEVRTAVLDDNNVITEIEDLIPITFETPPPPPAAPKIPVLSDQIDIVDDEIEIDDNMFLKLEDDPGSGVEIMDYIEVIDEEVEEEEPDEEIVEVDVKNEAEGIETVEVEESGAAESEFAAEAEEVEAEVPASDETEFSAEANDDNGVDEFAKDEEEEKSEVEPLKIWGKIDGDKIVDASGPSITTQCLRVPVSDGHTAAVFVSFDKKPSIDEIKAAWKNFKGAPQELNLPSAPKQFLNYFEEDNRPQAKLDRDLEGGMAVSIGRLREDKQYDYKFVCLSHNTLRGAAGGAVLMAELLAAKGYLD